MLADKNRPSPGPPAPRRRRPREAIERSAIFSRRECAG
jgi:hypothetical protein